MWIQTTGTKANGSKGVNPFSHGDSDANLNITITWKLYAVFHLALVVRDVNELSSTKHKEVVDSKAKTSHSVHAVYTRKHF